MSKVILVMVDALGYQTAWARCGYLGHLIETKKGALYRVQGELPAQSRPMYETVMTGLPASIHGIYTNEFTGPSKSESIFSLIRKNKKTSAAAAYMWIAELYNYGTAYSAISDRYQMSNTKGLINNGIFYSADDYPDSHLYADGDYLRRAFQPDFLLIHPMNVDYQGHRYGQGSKEYEHSAEVSLCWLSQYVESWRQAGYDVLVTADHGMDEIGIHYGDTPMQREVPLFIFSDRVEPGNFTDHTISQLNAVPLACALLGIARGEGMIDPAKEIRGLT